MDKTEKHNEMMAQYEIKLNKIMKQYSCSRNTAIDILFLWRQVDIPDNIKRHMVSIIPLTEQMKDEITQLLKQNE